MTLLELLNRANKAYPDEFLSEYYDEATGAPKDGDGDTLAQFIVREIRDTFDDDASESDQLAEARRVLGTAVRELERVIDALSGG